MKSLTAAILILFSTICLANPFGQPNPKLSPACAETAKVSEANLQVIALELKVLDGKKEALTEKRSVVFAAKSACPEVYFINRIQEIRSAVTDFERKLKPVLERIRRVEGQTGIQGHYSYWKDFAAEFKDALTKMGEGRGPGLLLPQFKATYLTKLNAQRKDLEQKIETYNTKIAQLQNLSERIAKASITELDIDLSLSSQEMDLAIAGVRRLIDSQISFVRSDRTCTEEDVKTIQALQSENENATEHYVFPNMDKAHPEFLKKHLNDIEELDFNAEELRRNCKIRVSANHESK